MNARGTRCPHLRPHRRLAARLAAGRTALAPLVAVALMTAVAGTPTAALAAPGMRPTGQTAGGAGASAGTGAGTRVVAVSLAPGTGRSWVSAAFDGNRARLVGLSWAATAPRANPVTFLRALGPSGWSAWQRLQAADGGPDPGSREQEGEGVAGVSRMVTEPLWLSQPATQLQVRVDAASQGLTSGSGAASVPGLRVHLITPDLTPTPSPTLAAAAGTSAGAPQPSIITRAQWGANESLRRCFAGYGRRVKVAFIHHTATSNSYAATDSAAIVRAIYAYHVQVNGWCDLGYNFLVDRYGQIFEGRWGGTDRPVIGAQTIGFNINTMGASLIGTFPTTPPPAAAVSALERLLAWKLDLGHANPLGTATLTSGGGTGNRYPAGVKATFDTISGHRDATATICPGTAAYALLPTIRAQVAAIS